MYRAFVKRLLDIIISLIALPFVLLAVLIMAPFIYFCDRGPIFYNAPRRGKDGKEFKMFKLRSMYVNSPNLKNADGSTFNSDSDPRVTKVGRFMRKTSVDELPQILNVLLGHMSFIGPRPTLPTTPYEKLPEISKRRLGARPGITGYAQAYYRNSITQQEKFQYDCYYVEHLSFWLDVKIIFKTITVVLLRKNIYVSNESAPAEPVQITKE
ncbi:MAG: sugar transferase [Ruminococcaceae bacterium]|nr:sugar transferase [Oscillospiraceae bacterium]